MACSQAKCRAPSLLVAQRTASAPVVGQDAGDATERPALEEVDDVRPTQAFGSSQSVEPSGDNHEIRESALDQVRFEGRVGASLEAMCAAWKIELLAAVKGEHDAGFGFDNYDADAVVCARRKGAPRLEGVLPHGWTIVASVTLQYFDGVARLDDRYLLLKRADGATVIGPRYYTSNDIGDTAPPAASRLAVVPLASAVLLVVVSLEIGDRPDPLDRDGMPGPNAQYAVRHSARTCRFEPMRFNCDATEFATFRERVVNGAERAVLLKAPRPDLPALDANSGRFLDISSSEPRRIGKEP